MGTIVAGGGAALGTGAFSSVEAKRDANFTVQNDGSALLTLTGDDTYVTETSDGSAGTGNIIEFGFTDLNDNATSTFEGVLTITNNTQDTADKDVYISDDGTVTANGVIDFVDSSGTEGSIVGSSNAATLADGGSITCDIVIDTTQGDPSSVTTITVVGEDNN